MAVEPDLTEPRGLRRGLGGSDMEIAEVCSFVSDVNVREEPHPQVPVMEFTADEDCRPNARRLAARKTSRRRETFPEVKPLC